MLQSVNKIGWLTGWKDIAQYCGLSVDGVKNLNKKGLPVFKLPSGMIASLPQVLDKWMIENSKKIGRSTD